MTPVGKLPYKVHGYCATCGKDFGRAKAEFLGHRIECANREHLARVISIEDRAAWWLRLEECLLRWQLCYSPFGVMRCIQNFINQYCCKERPTKLPQAGFYLVISFLVILGALFLESELFKSQILLLKLAFGILTIWRFADIFFSGTSITFTSRSPANPLRSVIFSLVAFVQIVLCYAYFYCILYTVGAIGAVKEHVFSVMEAVYFSFGTIATVGYGFLEPKNWFGQVIIASELVCGLYFVVIILAQVATWNSQSRVELGTFPWDDLKE
jgi:hypothetical protein